LTAEFCEKLSLFAGHAYTFPTEFYDSQLCRCHLIKPDPRIKSGFITYDSPKGGGTIKDFYLNPQQPKESGIIVCMKIS
jgi:carboxymethylenebutenolidase